MSFETQKYLKVMSLTENEIKYQFGERLYKFCRSVRDDLRLYFVQTVILELFSPKTYPKFLVMYANKVKKMKGYRHCRDITFNGATLPPLNKQK